jgi:glycosyltransferase involved in cell wall biosynthesis
MRIGFDVAQTCGERAGCSWYADSLAHAMAEMLGPSDRLILYHQFGSWLNADTLGGTRLSSPRVTMPLSRHSRKDAAKVWADPGHSRLGRPDIVHANSYHVPRVRGARLILTVYDVSFWSVPQFTTDENRVACQRGVLRALGIVDGLLFISYSARAEFERFLPGWIEKRGLPVAVTHLGPRKAPGDDPAGSVVPPSTNGPFWLAVGTLEPRKNYETLLAAVRLYRTQSAQLAPLLIVGGEGWKSAGLRREIAALESSGAVRYLGYVPESELANLYRSAQGLIFPSWYEGFGLPVLEAMGYGCPVISSDRTSLREVGGAAAQYVDPARPEAIAESMIALEENPDRAALREASRTQARQFSWAKTARETFAFYQQVLAMPA